MSQQIDANVKTAGKLLTLLLLVGAALGLFAYLIAPAAPGSAIVPDSPGKDGSTMTNSADPSSTPAPTEAPPATKQPPDMTGSLQETCRALVVGSAVWLAAGCASVPVRPEPSTCPEAAIVSMNTLGMRLDNSRTLPSVIFDIHATEKQGFCSYRTGPVEGKVRSRGARSLPEGTRLIGRAWADEQNEKTWIIYTEAWLPGAEASIPVCLSAMPFGKGLGWGAKSILPGGTGCADLVYPVESWPSW